MCSNCTFKFDHDINAPIREKEVFIKISAENSKVNKTVIFMKENVGKCFAKVKIKPGAVEMLFIITIVLYCCQLQVFFMGFYKKGFCPRQIYNIEKAML